MSFEDETNKLKLATSVLPIGTLVKSADFSMEEAMSAIEFMIPKMDAGCNMQETVTKLNAIRDNVLTMPLTEEGECRVADILIGQLLAWLSGQLYIQSVHSSMFVVEKERLASKDLASLIGQVLELCMTIRQFMVSGGVSDEEDFVGYMFGFNEELEGSRAPQLTSYLMGLRIRFISCLMELLLASNDQSDSDVLNRVEKLMDVISELRSSIHPLSDDLKFLDETVDPSMHRNLLPSGPPKFVPPVKDSALIYEEWFGLIASLKGGLQILSASSSSSPFDLITKLGKLRRAPGFRQPFIRNFLFHRTREQFKTGEVVLSWLTSCCGGSLTPFTSDLSEDLKTFIADSGMVMNQVIFGLFRSPARQHRSIKKLLANLCVLQHRAWDLNVRVKANAKTGFSPSGLWAFTAALGCCLIQLNLLLNIELDLVDTRTRELSVVFVLMEKVLSVKVFVLNNLVTFIRSGRKINPQIQASLKEQMLIAALEHAFARHAFSIGLKHTQRVVQEEELMRIFELRSIPLSAFPLPKTVTFEEYSREATHAASGADDECLSFIDKASLVYKNGLEGLLIGTDLNAVKKTVINNKLMELKHDPSSSSQSSIRFQHKYHWIVPCLAKPH
jgi:hypothetical protein